MDRKTHSHVAFAMLVAAKIFGIAGLVLGATDYRLLGGVLLGLDGVLLVVAVVIALRSMRDVAVEEETHKQVLVQMIEDGTLHQYLRDLGAPASRIRDLQATLTSHTIRAQTPGTDARGGASA